MKKYGSIVLALALAFCVLTLGISAQAENKLKTAWQKGFTSAVEEKTDTDGTKYVSATGIEQAWYSPFINVYDAVKAVVGDEEEAEVMFAFEMRVKYKDEGDAGTPITARVIIRPSGLAESLKDTDQFVETYGTEGMFKNDSGNVMGYFDSSMSTIETTGEWTVFECSHLISKSDLNDAYWTGWDLCVDMISQPELLSALEFRNVGVYSYDNYESMIPEPTEEPVTPAPPTEKPTPTQVANTPVGLAPTATAGEGTAADGEQDDGNNTTTIVIVCVVAAIVIAAIVVGVVVAKKKKAGEDTGETTGNNDTKE